MARFRSIWLGMDLVDPHWGSGAGKQGDGEVHRCLAGMLPRRLAGLRISGIAAPIPGGLNAPQEIRTTYARALRLEELASDTSDKMDAEGIQGAQRHIDVVVIDGVEFRT
ncbi:hypothetical protein C8Q73DRAFT_121852 [Cubamyces lactineus]|nr:hypothetical protein C8Q73DRAFT_121852 [Cubamyces lactineus]